MEDKIINKLLSNNVNAIGKTMDKVLRGKGTSQDLYDIAVQIVKYNINLTLPDYDSNILSFPKLKVAYDDPQNTTENQSSDNQTSNTEDKGADLDGLYEPPYMGKGNVISLSPTLFNNKELKNNPQKTLLDLLETVSHETRHWYQTYEQIRQKQEQKNSGGVSIDNNVSIPLMSGEGDIFFEAASNIYGQDKRITKENIMRMYRNVSREEVAQDYEMLFPPTEDKEAHPAPETLERYEMIYRIASHISYTQYTNSAVELDARLAGIIGAINLSSGLKNSKFKNVQELFEGVSVDSIRIAGVNREMENDRSTDFYDNFVRKLPIERFVEMMKGISDPEAYEGFKYHFLSKRPQEEIEKIMVSALAMGAGKDVKQDISLTENIHPVLNDYDKLPHEKLREMFSSGVVRDDNGNTIEISPKGYETLLSLNNFKVSIEDRKQKAQEFIRQGKVEWLSALNPTVEGMNIIEIIEISDELRDVYEQNKDNILTLVGEGKCSEKRLEEIIGSGFVEKHMEELNAMRLKNIENFEGQMSSGMSESKSRQVITRLVSDLVIMGEEAYKNGEVTVKSTQYFEAVSKYQEILFNLIDARANNLDREEFDKLQENNQEFDKKNLSEKMRFDVSRQRNVLEGIGRDSEADFLFNARSLLRCCQSRNEYMKAMAESYKQRDAEKANRQENAREEKNEEELDEDITVEEPQKEKEEKVVELQEKVEGEKSLEDNPNKPEEEKDEDQEDGFEVDM